MAYVKLRPRRGSKQEWEYNNPILMEGEMGIEYPETGIGSGFCRIKFGDGVTPWKELPYSIAGDGDSDYGEI